jgi:hypothetical protein
MRTRRTKVIGGRCDGQYLDLPPGQTEALGRDDRFGYQYVLAEDGALHYTGQRWLLPPELQDPGTAWDWPAFENEFAQYCGAAPVTQRITITE